MVVRRVAIGSVELGKSCVVRLTECGPVTCAYRISVKRSRPLRRSTFEGTIEQADLCDSSASQVQHDRPKEGYL